MALTRSQIMARVRSSGTGPERAFARELRAIGIRHRRNVRSLPGTPDFVVGSTAVFVHGCFWHQCPRHGRAPSTNRAFWGRKFDSNRRRDARVRRQINRLGFSVRVVWEHEDPAAAARRLNPTRKT